jgi:RNA polymerase sigma-70 factor (ECF subfamily)
MTPAQYAPFTAPRSERPEKANGNAVASCDYEAAVLNCAAGSCNGIGELYIKEYASLRRVARRITRDWADDVVHDAFLQIIREAKGFDPARGSAQAWIYTIVRNTALRKFRSNAREINVDDDTLTSICDRESTTVPSPHIAEYDGLQTCLKELDPKRRASLILTIVDGRTHAEVAALLDVPIGTVKAWIRRELIALRERLK